MVPAWVLLRRKIYFEHDASASGAASESGEESRDGASAGGSGRKSLDGDSAGGSGKKSLDGASAVGSGKKSVDGASAGGSGKKSMGDASGLVRGVQMRQDVTDAILDYLQSLKPDASFANPPELSVLRLLRPTESIPRLCGSITSALIASADKGLVALYAGPYRPGTDLKGGYLIYDASKNSLSTIPKPPYDYARADLGLGALVVALVGEEDSYLLCELTKIRDSDPTEAVLCIWRPSSPEWKVEAASFPPELSQPNYFFKADRCFSYQGSILCWVDLFKGILLCDMLMGPVFSFIPLPQECMTYNREGQRFERPRQAEEFRSIAYTGGSIKFITMDGYGQRPGKEVSLVIWTLLRDLHRPCWNKGKEYHVRDIWASNAYLRSGLPKILPSFPVLSMSEDDVVCLVVTHWNMAVNGKVEYKGQHLLSVDMQHNKVSIRPQDSEQMHYQLFASECSAYQQRSEDHQGKIKARKVGASGKRVAL